MEEPQYKLTWENNEEKKAHVQTLMTVFCTALANSQKAGQAGDLPLQYALETTTSAASACIFLKDPPFSILMTPFTVLLKQQEMQ